MRRLPALLWKDWRVAVKAEMGTIKLFEVIDLVADDDLRPARCSRLANGLWRPSRNQPKVLTSKSYSSDIDGLDLHHVFAEICVTYEMLFATFSFGIQKLTDVRTLGRAPRSLSRLLDD
jgi:hypothetical protein